MFYVNWGNVDYYKFWKNKNHEVNGKTPLSQPV